MKQSQKTYDSNDINNLINRSKSIHYHKKNLMEIRNRKNRGSFNYEEDLSVPKNKNVPNKNLEVFEILMINNKIYNRLQSILSSPSRFKIGELTTDVGNNQKRVLEYHQKIKEERIKIENEKFSKRINKKIGSNLKKNYINTENEDLDYFRKIIESSKSSGKIIRTEHSDNRSDYSNDLKFNKNDIILPYIPLKSLSNNDVAIKLGENSQRFKHLAKSEIYPVLLTK